MNKNEKLFLANLLELAADEFGSHGCNDLSKQDYKMLTNEDKIRMKKEYLDLNIGDEDCADEFWENDSSSMYFFARKLRNEANCE